MTIEPGAITGLEDRPFAPFPDRKVNRACSSGREWDDDDLAALAKNREGAVTAFKAELFNVRTDRFRNPEAVQREQADQRVLLSAAESGGHQHRSDLVAVQAGRMRFVVEPRPADVDRG